MRRRLPPAGFLALTLLPFGLGLASPTPAAADDPAPSAFSLDRWLDGPSPLASGPEIGAWRPGHDAWVVWQGRGPDRALAEVDAATGTRRVLVRAADLDAARGGGPPSPGFEGIGRAGPAALLWARGGDVLVVAHEGDLVRVDVASGRCRRLLRTVEPVSDVRLAPDGDAVAYARGGELWMTTLGEDGPTDARRTTDGSDDVLNATLDWVYPEELDATTAIHWTPDGSQVVFLQLDETRVPKVALADPIPLHGEVTWQRYPKAGDRNPVPRLRVVARAGGPPRALDLGAGDGNDVYLPWFAPTPDGAAVLAAVMPRSQTWVEVRRVPLDGRPPTTWWRDEDPRWVDVPDPPRFLADGTAALLRSRRGGWWRVWHVPLDDREPAALTPDGGDARLLAVDDAAGAFLFAGEHRATLRAFVERRPLLRGVPLGVAGERVGGDASHVATSCAPDGRWWVDETSRLDLPPTWTLRRGDGTAVRELGRAATAAWAELGLPAPTLVRLPGDPELVATVRRPKAFDPARRWPVVFRVYGGPGSRMVRDAFAAPGFDAVLAEAGFVVVTFDGRGTSGRGKDFEATVHRRLGTCEVEDLVAAADRLAAEPWFDRTRVGVWGWSYGGTFAALAAARAPDLVRAAAAVAPVTDWRLYDTIYTERYMDLPAENEAGYRAAAVTTHAAAVRGRLLLAHGLADDNVHAQHTFRLVDALVTARVPFDLQVYPQKSHGLGGTAHRHVHARVRDHFVAWLRPGPAPAEPARVEAPGTAR